MKDTPHFWQKIKQKIYFKQNIKRDFKNIYFQYHKKKFKIFEKKKRKDISTYERIAKYRKMVLGGVLHMVSNLRFSGRL